MNLFVNLQSAIKWTYYEIETESLFGRISLYCIVSKSYINIQNAISLIHEFLRQFMIIGYARVPTKDQNLDLQIEALKNAGCERIFKAKISGATKERPELEALLNHLREGDTVVVWKLDRLGRSLKKIIDLVLDFSAKQVTVRGLTDGVDTSTSNGRLF